MPLTARRGDAVAGVADQAPAPRRCSGRLPSSVTVTAVPDTGAGRWSQEQSRRIGDALDSVVVQQETADLVGCAEPVLDAAHHAQRRVRSPSKCSTTSTRCSSDRGPGDRAVLGDVADQDASRRPVVLASHVSAVVTARTWVTPPVTPSASVVDMVCTESTTTRSAAPPRCGRARSADRIRRPGTPRRGVQPVRSARSRIWPADSSPDRYSARRPAAAQRCATSSSSVDLPTPGSPASSVTEPGTRPPPSTRSSSLTPVGQCRVLPGSIELIGTAGEVGATARRVGRAVRPRPARRPRRRCPRCRSPGSGPTHLAVTWWHSEQRYCERALATTVTVAAAADRLGVGRVAWLARVAACRAPSAAVGVLVAARRLARRDRHRDTCVWRRPSRR